MERHCFHGLKDNKHNKKCQLSQNFRFNAIPIEIKARLFVDMRNLIPHCSTRIDKMLFKKKKQDFPGGAVVGNPPANAGDTGSCPGPGRSHMPRSN